MGETPELLKAR